MANRLADLNRSRRDYAYSGRATTGDVPWLYALQEAQAAANAPSGIGQPAGGPQDAAPNPQAPVSGGGMGGGGGTSGAADTGMPGPGQSGLGPEGDEMFRAFVAAREGGQSGELTGVGMSENPYADPSGFGTVGSLGGLFGIPGLGLLGAGIGAAYDAEIAQGLNENYDPSFGDWLSAFGNMATGGLIGTSHSNLSMDRARFEGPEAEAAFGPAGDRDFNPAYDSSLGGYGDMAFEAVGGFGGDTTVTGDAQAVGGGGGGRNRGRSQPRSTSPGRRGARESTRQISQRELAESGQFAGGGFGGGGGGGFADSNRDEAAGRGAGPGGFGAGHAGPGGGTVLHEGGYLDEGMVPGQTRADVPATLQEGEGVLTADAVEMLGPGFVQGVNMMARMMRGRY